MVLRPNDFVLHEFGFFLWELISKQPLISWQPRAKHGEASHLVLFLESIVNFLFTQLFVQLLTI
jgi:hypothetical protein